MDLPGGYRRTTLPMTDFYAGTLPDLLFSACGPLRQRRAPGRVTWTPRPDGQAQAAVPDDDGVKAAWTARRLALACG